MPYFVGNTYTRAGRLKSFRPTRLGLLDGVPVVRLPTLTVSDRGVSTTATVAETGAQRRDHVVIGPDRAPSISRIAFLTPEFVTEKGATGGVGAYVLKMAKALTDQGLEAEVFVASREPGVVEYQGLRVERVANERSLLVRGAARSLRPLVGPQADVLVELANARRLARALERRHEAQPFDVVQSSNYNLTGAFVARAAGRRHLIRISTSRTLYDQARGSRQARTSRWVERLDARIMRRADAVYAPSRLLADFFGRTYGLDVGVVRPPAELGTIPATTFPFPLPERYLIHFGSLGERKGTDLVAQALTAAWRVEPALRMVWIGPIDERTLASYRASWGTQGDHVAVLGKVEKSLTYGAVSGAVASVLPSKVDNLPNTVIESLILGVPVIGSDGASIDELVEDGVSGALVAIGDVEGLTRAMLEAWRGEAPWVGTGFRAPAMLHEMRPERAVERFLELAGPPAPSP